MKVATVCISSIKVQCTLIFHASNFKGKMSHTCMLDDSPWSISSPCSVLFTVILEGTGKCSISSPDLPSLAFFFCNTNLVGRGCKKDITMSHKLCNESSSYIINKSMHRGSYQIFCTIIIKCNKVCCGILFIIPPYLNHGTRKGM